MTNETEIISYKKSNNRLLIIDWASLSYHQWFSIISKNNPKFYELDTPEKEIFSWKTVMASKIAKLIKIFNPLDMIICLEGTGVLWRKTYYNDYYTKNTKIFYNSSAFYVKFDNFLYKIHKKNDNIIYDKIDPTTKLENIKHIEFNKLPYNTQNIIKQIIPTYKGNRKKFVWKHLTDKNTWVEIRDKFAYEIGEITRANVIHVPEAEGDDIMYVAINYNKNKYEDIVLVTGDSDALQLLDIKNLVIYNHRKENFEICLNPRKYIELKILMGDNADNINGIVLPGKKTQLGEKGAEKLYESLNENIIKKAEEEGWINQYYRNRTLIDMSFIPFEIKNKIEEEIKNSKKTEVSEIDKIYNINISKKIIEEFALLRNLGYFILNDLVQNKFVNNF